MRRSRVLFMLVLDAVISAVGYLLLKVALNANLSPALIVMGRGIVGTLLCLAFYYKEIRTSTKREILTGSILGIINFGGFILTTVSMDLSTPSIVSFLLASSIVLVPFISWAVMKKAPTLQACIAAVVGLLGVAVLSDVFGAQFSLNLGNALAFLAAILFSIHVTYVGKLADTMDYRKLVFFTMLFLLIGGFIYALFVPGSFSLAGVKLFPAIASVVGLGLGASFIYFLIQVMAQMHVDATTASLVLSSDAFFTSVLSILFGFESITLELAIGGVLILAAIVILEVKVKRKKKPVDAADETPCTETMPYTSGDVVHPKHDAPSGGIAKDTEESMPGDADASRYADTVPVVEETE